MKVNGDAAGSSAIGSSGQDRVQATFWRRVAPHVVIANGFGFVFVYLYLMLISPQTASEESYILEFGASILYLVLGAFVGALLGRRTFRPVTRWIEQGRPPSHEELKLTLQQPQHHAGWIFMLWVGGALAFAGIHMIPSNPLHYDVNYGIVIGGVVILGGLATAMLSYLLIENSMRPLFALALSHALPSRPRTLGVRQRIIISWALGSGVVFLAIALTPVGSPRIVLAVLLLVPVGLLAGGSIITFAAKSVANPISALRRGVARVEEGDFAARVPVDDASEVGLLQAGFNRMAAGLAERERLRQVFGSYVDPDVAEHILREGTSLAGEEVDVTVMFVDVRDFTGYAERASAREVVATMNQLFELVVPTIHAHEGHVDKFVGDGALAVFGAPRRRPDHADRALAAAIEIDRRVSERFNGELEIGIGLNSGPVIAGNVGGAGRFEFSVIGDVVNVAARIEAATRDTGDVILISEQTKARLREPAVELSQRRDIALKGKQQPLCLYAPAHPVGARNRPRTAESSGRTTRS